MIRSRSPAELWAAALEPERGRALPRTGKLPTRRRTLYPRNASPALHSARSRSKRELKLGRRFGATQNFLHKFTKRSISASWVANEVTRRAKTRSAPRSRFWLGRT